MAEGVTSFSVFGVFLGGFLPALLWLWFWLKEDPHPEPRRTLLLSFIFGMAAVPVVLALEYLFYLISVSLGIVRSGALTSLVLLFGWAFLEEAAKFFTAWWADLRRSVYDEPVDAMIYLITVALGFAALENVLFLSGLLKEGLFALLLAGNLRFFGASLLHVLTAGVMGASIAFSFFHREHQSRNIWGGVILATLLHTGFNAFIINSKGPETLFRTFAVLWVLVIILIFLFERVKRIDPQT